MASLREVTPNNINLGEDAEKAFRKNNGAQKTLEYMLDISSWKFLEGSFEYVFCQAKGGLSGFRFIGKFVQEEGKEPRIDVFFFGSHKDATAKKKMLFSTEKSEKQKAQNKENKEKALARKKVNETCRILM